MISDSPCVRVGDSMSSHSNPLKIALAKAWPKKIHAVVLQVISRAHFAMVYSRSWAVISRIARVRLQAEKDPFKQQLALLREEIRIKDARMTRIAPAKRPHY